MMEKTFFMIKPEAINKSEKIKSIIKNNGFNILETKRVALTSNDLSVLSEDSIGYLDDEKMFRTYEYFMKQDVLEVGVIQGENVIENFRMLCGKLAIPQENPQNTIRKEFGVESKYYKGIEFYLNAIHKSQDLVESTREVNLFYNTLKKRSLLENLQEIAQRVYTYPNENTPKPYIDELNSIWNFQVLPTVENISHLSTQFEFNLEQTKIAGYFNNIGKVLSNDENHKLKSKHFLEYYLNQLNVQNSEHESISNILSNNEDSINPNTQSIEQVMLNCAQGMTTIQHFPLLFYSSYSEHNVGIKSGVQQAKIKLENAWNNLLPNIQMEMSNEYSLIQKTLGRF